MAKECKGIRLVAGLGNIGRDYEGTRHNAGFLFADALSDETRTFFSEEKKFSAFAARTSVAGSTLWIIKPTTYMNLSGNAVQAVSQYFHILPEEIIVVHDELDLAPGCVKLKFGGGNAGHNGLRDIAQKLGTPNFWRLRIGTGHPRTLGLAQSVIDFVLHRPSEDQRSAMEECVRVGVSCIDELVRGDFQAAQRRLAPLGKPRPAKTSPDGGDAAATSAG